MTKKRTQTFEFVVADKSHCQSWNLFGESFGLRAVHFNINVRLRHGVLDSIDQVRGVDGLSTQRILILVEIIEHS